MKYDWKLWADLLTIGGDGALGIILAIALFTTQTHAKLPLIVGGACAAMLPDALQLRGRPVLGVASQFAFVIVFLIAMHPLLPN